MPPEYDEKHRRERIRELQDSDRRLQAEVADFEAAVNKKRRDISGQISRLQLQFPPGDVCPYCWVIHEIERPLRNIPEDPVQPMRDRFLCLICRYEEIRET